MTSGPYDSLLFLPRPKHQPNEAKDFELRAVCLILRAFAYEREVVLRLLAEALLGEEACSLLRSRPSTGPFRQQVRTLYTIDSLRLVGWCLLVLGTWRPDSMLRCIALKQGCG